MRPGRDKITTALISEVASRTASPTRPPQQLAAQQPSTAPSAAAGTGGTLGARDAADPRWRDSAERRLGWIAVAASITVVGALAGTLSTLPMRRDVIEAPASQQPPIMTLAPGTAAASPATDPSAAAVTAPPPPLRSAGTAAALGASSSTPSMARPGGARGQRAGVPVTIDVPPTTAPPVGATTHTSGIQTAVAAMRAAIRYQVDSGHLDPVAGADLHSKVDQVAREASEGDLTRARYYAGRIRDKLGKYRDDRLLTPDAYQMLIAHLDVLDQALA
jgi:hypothetical protein